MYAQYLAIESHSRGCSSASLNANPATVSNATAAHTRSGAAKAVRTRTKPPKEWQSSTVSRISCLSPVVVLFQQVADDVLGGPLFKHVAAVDPRPAKAAHHERAARSRAPLCRGPQ